MEHRAAHTFYIVFKATLDLVQQRCLFHTQFMGFEESISLLPQSTHIRNESPGNDHGHSIRLRHPKIPSLLLGKQFFFFFFNYWWAVVWLAFLGTTATVDAKVRFRRRQSPRRWALRHWIKFESPRRQDLWVIILCGISFSWSYRAAPKFIFSGGRGGLTHLK